MSATSTSGTANQAGFAPLASLRLRLPLICISVNITLEQQVRRLDPVVGEDPHAVVGQLLHRDFEVPASERGNIAAEPGDLLIDEPSLLVEAFHEKLNAPRAGAAPQPPRSSSAPARAHCPAPVAEMPLTSPCGTTRCLPPSEAPGGCGRSTPSPSQSGGARRARARHPQSSSPTADRPPTVA